MANYSYVIDSSFQPFSMQEMLTPLMLYKDAYEKTEDSYYDLQKGADVFKYLADKTKDNPTASAIYEGYVNDLRKSAEDLSKHGLTMGNRRALAGLKRRYQGEIGRLEQADIALREEQKLRQAARANGQNMLYATDNLSIDQFLDNETPNMYGINAEDLRKEAAQYAQATSSRIYGDTRISDINKYFQEIVQSQGYSPEVMAAWRQNLESIPEFNQAVNDIMESRQVNGNLTGRNWEIARQSIINGIMEGTVYQDRRQVQQNPGVLTAAQEASNEIQKEAGSRAQQQLELSALQSGYIREGNEWKFKPEVLRERAEALGVSNYNSDEWEVGPDGKLKRKSTKLSPEEKKEDKKGEALMKLDRSTLANSGGFDVTFNNDRHHYDWIAALSKHGETWYSGKEGDDNPGHDGIRGFGFGSTSNVENWWGNFTYEPGDKATMRILSPSEIETIMNDTEIASHINQQLAESGFYNNAILSDYMTQYNVTQEEAIRALNNAGLKYTNDIQIAAVNNEWPYEDLENYLVAVRTK